MSKKKLNIKFELVGLLVAPFALLYNSDTAGWFMNWIYYPIVVGLYPTIMFGFAVLAMWVLTHDKSSFSLSSEWHNTPTWKREARYSLHLITAAAWIIILMWHEAWILFFMLILGFGVTLVSLYIACMVEKEHKKLDN